MLSVLSFPNSRKVSCYMYNVYAKFDVMKLDGKIINVQHD